jgi:phosphoribosyl-ATP pyrophosphohydrolase/phosphoribosyl-AMP cyclohydrolase
MFKPDFDKHDLIPAIVQNSDTGRVLMLAYMNREAFELTKSSGFCHFWSRSRNEIWKKGSTSGNLLRVVSLQLDCDSDSILVIANPAGPSCHTGSESCFDAAKHEIDISGLDD